MNRIVQILNRPLILSIAIHLIAIAVASFFIIKITDAPSDAIVAEFVSHRQAKPPVAQRRWKMPITAQPTLTHSLPEQMQRHLTVVQSHPGALQPVVDMLPVSYVSTLGDGAMLTGISALGADTPSRRLPPQPVARSLAPTRLTPPKTERPVWTSAPAFIASAEAAEPPAVPIFTDTPIEDARFFRKVDPIYPDAARLAHQQGLVVLEATIGTDGIARDIKVVKVVEVKGLGCEAAAIAALKASRFVPAKQGTVVIEQRLRIPYRFQFKN